MSRGKKQTIFDYNGKKFSVLICFEDIFADFVSAMAKGRNFLVNITNDEWFKGNPQATQHLGIMAVRAIENRISIVRSANTGISGWARFDGKIERLVNYRRSLFVSGLAKFRVELNKERSIYNKWGDLVFETEDTKINWDGTIADSDRKVSGGVYYYICEIYEERIGGTEPRSLVGFIHVYTQETNSYENE